MPITSTNPFKGRHFPGEVTKGYGSFWTAWRTLQGIETVDMIRKGRVRWVAKNDAVAQAAFVAELFGLAA